jgi:hypothetical protein
MSYVCGECGEVHGEQARFFEWRRPRLRSWELRRLRFDNRFTCRIPGRKYFIFCEVELPFADRERKPLGFMGWAQVTQAVYLGYARFHRAAVGYSYRRRFLVGRLATPVPAVPRSIGTRIRLNAFRDDPTPYVRWAAQGSPLARRMKEGANDSFWHQALKEMDRDG